MPSKHVRTGRLATITVVAIASIGLDASAGTGTVVIDGLSWP